MSAVFDLAEETIAASRIADASAIVGRKFAWLRGGTGDDGAALALSRALAAHGVLVSAIRPPTVPEGQARLRVTLSAAHREADVDRLLGALEDNACRV